MTSPARVQYPRFSITGQYPDAIAPGAIALNLTDRKLYVGNLSGQPLLMSQYITDWQIDLAYATGDLVLNQLQLYRAKNNITAGTPFSGNDWEVVASSLRAEYSVPSASGIISGGVVTQTAGFTDRLSVTEGEGVIVEADDPANILISPFNWDAFDITIPPPGGVWSVLGINQNGSVSSIPYASFDHSWRDLYVTLAYVAWNGAAIYAVVDASYTMGDTATAFLDEYFDRGGAYRSTGIIISPHGADLSLKCTSGTVFSVGDSWRVSPSPNLRSVAAAPLVNLTYFQSGVAPTPTTVINTNLWWNGSALAAVPVGKVTTQFISLSPVNSYFVSYGDTLYDSIAEAASNLDADWDNAQSPMVPLAAVVVPQGTTNLTTQGLIVVAQPNGDPYSNGVDTSSFLLLDGSRPMLGALNMNGYAVLNADIDGGTY